MGRGLFEGHIRVEPGLRDVPGIMETCKYQAVKFVAGRGGTNMGDMILNRKECEGKLTQVDFAVYADFPE